MGRIIPFPSREPSRFGYERARKRRKENPDQLKLFSPKRAEVLRLPTGISPFEEALMLDERGDGRAEASYRRAIEEGDLVVDAYCNLGIIESGAGRIGKAFDCFTKALEYDPRHFEAHYNLANLYFEAENLRLAKLHYELASEINPEFRNLWYNLGLVLALLDEKKAALDAFERFRFLAPEEDRRIADDLIQGLRNSLASPKEKGLPAD